MGIKEKLQLRIGNIEFFILRKVTTVAAVAAVAANGAPIVSVCNSQISNKN